jgi:flagellar biosynthesis/type III secretory pathway M-ring protein FliF/YscJ
VENLAPKAWQYGVLGVIALAFAYAIIHLFKALRADAAERLAAERAMEKERSTWATEREEIRTEFEEKHRVLVEDYNKKSAAEREENRRHEDQVRKEFAEIMERVAEESSKSSDAVVEILRKFYDRFVGPSSRGRY